MQIFAASRQRHILTLLRQTQELKVASLADELDVSQETIRRDLKALERSGRLRRVYGGAVAFRETDEPTYDERLVSLTAEKAAIADRVIELDLIREGQRIFLGSGSTILPLAQRLADHVAAKYVTNGIDIAAILAQSGRHDTTLTGGKLHPEYEHLTGQPVVDMVGRYVFDVAITGTSAVDVGLGFLDYFETESETHRILAGQSRTYVIVADHTKFGAHAEFRTFPFNGADILVTDRQPAAEFLAALASADVAVHWPGDGRSEDGDVG